MTRRRASSVAVLAGPRTSGSAAYSSNLNDKASNTPRESSAGLSHAELSRGVFDALSLRFDEYAADPEVRGPARTATDDALRRVIQYHVYRDLERGWRVT